jgi:hypothetical protein
MAFQQTPSTLGAIFVSTEHVSKDQLGLLSSQVVPRPLLLEQKFLVKQN